MVIPNRGPNPFFLSSALGRSITSLDLKNLVEGALFRHQQLFHLIHLLFFQRTCRRIIVVAAPFRNFLDKNSSAIVPPIVRPMVQPTSATLSLAHGAPTLIVEAVQANDPYK